MGATLTLPADGGVILTIFLALFISCVGLAIWSLLKYGLHQWRSTPAPRDALHHQQQLLLRSDVTDWRFLWRTLVMIQKWRSGRKDVSSIRRSAPMALVALTHALLVAAASILSSRLTNANDPVLVKSSKCGLPVISPLDILAAKQEDLPNENALYVSSLLAMQHSVEYTKACYRGVTTNVFSCNEFVQRHIDTTVNRTADCPFPGDVCTAPAISIDTGYLDSDHHLGLNAIAPNRISFRKKLTCAPVDANNYTSGWTTKAPPPVFPWDPDVIAGAAYKFYHFGDRSAFGVVQNWTFSVANYSGSFDKAYHLT